MEQSKEKVGVRVGEMVRMPVQYRNSHLALGSLSEMGGHWRVFSSGMT